MKKLMTLALAAGMLLGAAGGAKAVDFKAKGWWQFGFGLGEGRLVKKYNGARQESRDQFNARQRVRLQLDAVASEALSGTVFFEIGHQSWGKNSQGAAMGADGMVVKVRQAYLDWMVPDTDLKIRMGIQNMNLPSAAGDGSPILHNADMAGIHASCQFNDLVGMSLIWGRPFNDNYVGPNGKNANYLDNIDAFVLILPITGDGFTVTPWAMYGFRGANAAATVANHTNGFRLQNVDTFPFDAATYTAGSTSKTWASMFWAGLPVKVTALDPLNIEIDANYGWFEGMGNLYGAYRYRDGMIDGGGRASTRREGWLVKALVEYRMDWGTPGIFGWYASGDDDSLGNGSERIPFVYAETKFTSMMGEDVPYTGGWTDFKLSLDGSWGVGIQLKDISFVDDLKHTIRVAWIGGTNSPRMARYHGNSSYSTASPSYDATLFQRPQDLYMTTMDSVVEINLNSTWKIYDNLKMGLNLGYLVNNFDKATWKKSARDKSLTLQDAWCADLTFTYSF